jgi:SpoVK/Ycf46/Vps4 family AAA+-type ATPase
LEFRATAGRGVRALFSGPNGTGKTLGAEVLAARLGRDLHRVDREAVVSKYIGETEKNLRRVFDRAEGLDVILLFDEADALFGKRTDVRDVHDRCANLKANDLPQRIEDYKGVGVLATNLRENIDSAFTRCSHRCAKRRDPWPFGTWATCNWSSSGRVL